MAGRCSQSQNVKNAKSKKSKGMKSEQRMQTEKVHHMAGGAAARQWQARKAVQQQAAGRRQARKGAGAAATARRQVRFRRAQNQCGSRRCVCVRQ